jgi:hypothetical protein
MAKIKKRAETRTAEQKKERSLTDRGYTLMRNAVKLMGDLPGSEVGIIIRLDGKITIFEPKDFLHCLGVDLEASDRVSLDEVEYVSERNSRLAQTQPPAPSLVSSSSSSGQSCQSTDFGSVTTTMTAEDLQKLYQVLSGVVDVARPSPSPSPELTERGSEHKKRKLGLLSSNFFAD